ARDRFDVDGESNALPLRSSQLVDEVQKTFEVGDVVREVALSHACELCSSPRGRDRLMFRQQPSFAALIRPNPLEMHRIRATSSRDATARNPAWLLRLRRRRVKPTTRLP